MKNIFTLQKLFFCFVLLVSTMSVVHAQDIVHIPDANFKKALISNADINTNSDSEIQVSEAENYAGEISVPNLGITDLTGIEAFTSLTELYCFWNNLTHLDVSKNTFLTLLSCYDNNLFSLNLSNNSALTYLDCSWNNLTHLDVSKNTALRKLYCDGNNLSSLDVSSNVALEYLYCSYNNLSNLDIQNGKNTILSYSNFRNNLNLNCIQVDDMDYANANFKSKDTWAEYSTDCGTITGLKSGLAHISNIYPNPAVSLLTIETNEEILSKEVIGLDGLVKLEDRSSRNTLDVSTIPSGVYFVRIKTKSGSYQDKFVKQ
jgi:hypothetical protein